LSISPFVRFVNIYFRFSFVMEGASLSLLSDRSMENRFYYRQSNCLALFGAVSS